MTVPGQIMTMRKKGAPLHCARWERPEPPPENREYTLATKTFSTRCGTLNYHRLGSKTFGENEPVCRHILEGGFEPEGAGSLERLVRLSIWMRRCTCAGAIPFGKSTARY
jgi:hypothetical protein